MQAVTNAVIYTGESVIKEHHLLVDEQKIVAIVKELPADVQLIDLQGQNIAPGFNDIQLNGGTDIYFSSQPDTAALTDLFNTSCAFATPYCLATLISSPRETIREAINAIKTFHAAHPTMLGMHLEGPFMNPEKRGAHHPDIIRKPTDKELDEIIEWGGDIIKVMTIAPECFTDAQLEKLLKTNILLSAGHSMMTYEQAQRYFSMGIHLVTHLYNAMTQLGHRECGTVGAVFDNDAVYAPIILDGGHCHYAAARIAHRLKGDRLFLISDSAFLGRQKKRMEWEGLTIELRDGFYRDKNGNLGGAAISMPEAIKNAVEHVGISLQEAVEMATSRPAKALRMQHRIGQIKAGYPAVFSVFNDAISEYKTLMLTD